jgi:acyl carrier protein
MADGVARNEQSVLLELTPIFQTVLGNGALTLTADVSARDVDGWDSLAHMKLIVAIEEHFGIKLKLREIVRFRKVGDICHAIVDSAK